MQLPRKTILIGAGVGLIPIILGVVGLATQYWVNVIRPGIPTLTYGLFSCAGSLCSTKLGFPVLQGLVIAGVVAIAVGVIIAVVLDIFINNRWIHLLPQILLIVGPTLLLIGLILFMIYIFDDIGKMPSGVPPITFVLGYSMILIIVACVFGYIIAVYFAFFAGLGRQTFSSFTVQETVRF
jgi:hypothetical protein